MKFPEYRGYIFELEDITEKNKNEMLKLSKENNFYNGFIDKYFKIVNTNPSYQLFTVRKNSNLYGFAFFQYCKEGSHLIFLLIDKNHRNETLGKTLISFLKIITVSNNFIKKEIICETQTLDALRFFNKQDFKLYATEKPFLKLKWKLNLE